MKFPQKSVLKLPLILLCFALTPIGCQSPCHQGWGDPGYSSFSPSCDSYNVYGGCRETFGKTKRLFHRWLSRDDCEPRPYLSLGGYEPMKDEFAVKQAARRCSRSALRELHSRCGHWLSSDFRNGFEQAFLDLAMGGPGITPAIPPEKYWKAHFRTSEGHLRANDWFEGYRTGTSSAYARGVANYNYIPTTVTPESRFQQLGHQPVGYPPPGRQPQYDYSPNPDFSLPRH